MTPDEFRQQFMKLRGMSIDSVPPAVVAPPSAVIPPPTPVQTQRIVPTEPPPQPVVPTPPPPPITAPADQIVRMKPGGGIEGNLTSNRIDDPDKWTKGTNTDPVARPVVPPATVQPAFPDTPVAAVPNVAAGTGPAGITLNSAPVAPGWAGTVGLEAPADSKSFLQGQSYSDAMKGLEEISKGLKGPQNKLSADATTITPMTSQPNQGSQLGSELMATLLKSKMRPRGLTLTG